MGIRNAFRNAILKTGADPGLESKASEVYEEEERRIEKDKPYFLYRDVLSMTSLAVARKIGWKLPQAESTFLARELPNWTPFTDTNPSLARLATNHTLGILSNVDNYLLSGTLRHLTSPFEIKVTAENVKSYKPAFRHFEEARRIIGDRSWLHVAGSQYHDIQPAVELGIQAVWVNRKNARPTRNYTEKQVLEVKDLTELVKRLDA